MESYNTTIRGAIAIGPMDFADDADDADDESAGYYRAWNERSRTMIR